MSAEHGTAESGEPVDVVVEAIPDLDHEAETLHPQPGRFDLRGRSLREHAARGVLINSGFQVGFAALGLVQRFAVAAFLTATEFGVWGLVLAILVTLSWLKQVGISDKYVQQDAADQELAFQKAFTLELAYTAIFFVGVVTVLPLYALLFGREEVLLPSLVLALILLTSVFQTPIWIPYRQMRFVRQRVLESIEPIVSTAVMIPLAIAGAGYWSLIAGVLAGSVAAAILAVATSPYKLALRFDRGTLREYLSFSWPLLLASGAGLLTVQGTVIVGNFTIGLAGIGAITLAGSLLVFVDRVDGLISRTIYPAVCAVKDRTELLAETFVKSNRLALLWGLPFGIGMFLFAPDLVDFVLGERWRETEPILKVLGLAVGIRQIAFNWSIFFTATGNTKPLATSSIVNLGTFLIVTVPLMIVLGLDGYIIGAAVSFFIELLVRLFYVRRLFHGFDPVRHVVRAFGPSLPAVAAVVAVRALESGSRTFGSALAEFGLYVVVTVVASLLLERRLLGEMLGYVMGREQASPLPAATA